jgi:hypothetical protein
MKIYLDLVVMTILLMVIVIIMLLPILLPINIWWLLVSIPLMFPLVLAQILNMLKELI